MSWRGAAIMVLARIFQVDVFKARDGRHYIFVKDQAGHVEPLCLDIL